MMGYVGNCTTTAGKRGGPTSRTAQPDAVERELLEVQESMPRMPEEFLEELRAEPVRKRWTELVTACRCWRAERAEGS